MTVNYTTNLSLGQPVTGTESGTWGDDVNNALTAYLDIAIAGTLSFSGDGAVTLANTQGTNSVTNIGSTTAQYMVLRFSGALTTTKVVTGPSTSKLYLVDNTTSGGFGVTIKASGQTGYTVAAGTKAFVYYNGTDYVLASTNDLLKLTGSFTSGGVPYFSSSSAIASSAALAANAIVLGGGAGAAPATTTTGTGVVTAVGNAVNTTGGIVTQSGTLAANAFLLGGGASTAVSSTTTGTGVVTAVGNAVNTTGGLVTQSGTLAASALLLGGGASTAITSTTTGTGVVTALGVAVNTTAGGFPTIDGTATLTNKRVTPRVLASTANSATPTLNTDSYDMMVITGQSVAITSFTTNLTGTPTNGQKLWIAITGTTAIAITWGASFESSTVTLPTTTVTTNRLDVGFVWNVATSKWRCVASA